MVSWVQQVGAITLFCGDVTKALLKYGVRWREVVDQVYLAGVRSLPTIFAAGLFVGAIMAIQINLQLKDFGAQNFLGGLATSTTIRNIGPVLIAFMLSGKVGAYTSAELGTMRVTEQIDAIRCLGTDPIRYLIVPRMVGVILSSFLLLIVGLMVSIGGGLWIASMKLDVNGLQYLTNLPQVVTFWSVGTGIVKSFVFGGIIAVMCCYYGYYTTGGARGVGRSVRRTAVATLVCIIIFDFVVSGISNFIRESLGVGLL